MTTKQTIYGVPREQLVRWEEMLRTPPGRQELLDGLRALLDAAQPQGEPVANPVLGYADSYRTMARQGVETVSIWSVITDLERNIAPLYTEQPAQVAEPMAVINLGAKEAGNYGSLYDGPTVRRAYTCKHQPGNEAAAALGNAWLNTKRGGDSVDAGLSLLKQLERAGYGVFKV